MKKLLSSFLLFIFLFSSCNTTSDIIVIGHRGAMGHALENTIESVKKAINLKVDGIEIDVFKSKTGELIVYHDPSLGRLSNSTAFIEQISLDSIKKVELIGGLSIPTLNEVLDIIPEKIFLNIELKGENTAYETNKIIIKYLTESNLTPSKFIISSFRWDELKKFRNINKDVPIAILVDSLYKIDNKKDKVKEIINKTGLNGEIKKRIEELSKGYKQRVGIAAALVHDPNVLILDEPTSALGVRESAKVVEQIAQLREHNINVILVSHNIEQAFSLGDEFFIFKSDSHINIFDPCINCKYPPEYEEFVFFCL
mgnify:CR=1 FL=1